VIKQIQRVQEVALCLVRKWWRPITCIGIAGGAIVNLIIVPLKQSEPIDLAQAAAFVTACAGAFAVREWGKAKGTADQ
jgi:hypothetical protein